MNGRQKLAAYLESHGLTQLAFAELASVPGPQVSMWLSGRRRPGLASALKIERATGGTVPASSWLETKRGPRKTRPRRSSSHDKRAT